MTTEIETTTGTALAVTGDFWNDHQKAALAQLGVERASNADLAVYHHVCQRTGLDPFARQIYMIRRDGKQTIQTGIDGFRLVARRAVDRSGEVLSISAPEWCDAGGQWTEVWLDEKPPSAARVTVHRGDGTFPGIALWREYAQYKRDGSGLTSMWSTRSAGQLAKCAEALALRKAFPQDLSGVYTDDELGNDRTGGRSPRSTALADALADDDVIEGEVVEEQAGDESPLLNTRGKLAKRMYATINEAGISEKERLPWISSVIGREITSSSQMTDAEAEVVIANLAAAIEEPFGEQGGGQ